MSDYHVMKVASVVVLLSAAYTETVGCSQCLLWCGFARTDAILRVLQVERSEHLEGPCRISGAIERLEYQHNSAVIHCLRAYLLSRCSIACTQLLLEKARLRWACFLSLNGLMYIDKWYRGSAVALKGMDYQSWIRENLKRWDTQSWASKVPNG
jgi:hypothetical protein